LEGHLKWEGKNEGLGTVPQWDKRACGQSPQKLMALFCENMLFCHSFKNDIAIFAFAFIPTTVQYEMEDE